MNVLFISLYDPFMSSGPGNHILCLSEALIDLGCKVHILTPGTETKSVLIKGIFIHYLKSKPFARGFIFSLTSIKRTNQLIESYKIDIVHGQSPSSFGYSVFSGNQIPFVVTLHGTSFGELSSFSNVPVSNMTLGLIKDALFSHPLAALLTNLEYKYADMNVAVSNSIARELTAYYGIPAEKITVIHNGTQIHLRQPKTSKGATLLFVGRLIWRKGVKYLIDAMPFILSAFPDTKLLIVGNGEQKKYLADLIRTKNLRDSVFLLGRVSNQMLAGLYKDADVYLQPSLYEPCPLSILEAMSWGKPVIATNVGGIHELVRNGVDGFLVEPANSLQLVKAVKKVLADTSIRDNLGENAVKKIETYLTWQIIARKTVALYESLL